jgi:hypothetical protein
MNYIFCKGVQAFNLKYRFITFKLDKEESLARTTANIEGGHIASYRMLKHYNDDKNDISQAIECFLIIKYIKNTNSLERNIKYMRCQFMYAKIEPYF